MDRSFVLASTTMDRHLTYVAMTRHREAVSSTSTRASSVIGGRTDGGAARRRTRGAGGAADALGAKETVLDYAPAFAARRGLAERLGLGRGIVSRGGAGPEDRGAGQAVPPDLITELRGELASPSAEPPTPSRARHGPGRTSPRRRAARGLPAAAACGAVRGATAGAGAVGTSAGAGRRPAGRSAPVAVGPGAGAGALPAGPRRTRAASSEGLPRLESQREALAAAGLGLDAAQAGTQAALKEALQRDPQVGRRWRSRWARAGGGADGGSGPRAEGRRRWR